MRLDLGFPSGGRGIFSGKAGFLLPALLSRDSDPELLANSSSLGHVSAEINKHVSLVITVTCIQIVSAGLFSTLLMDLQTDVT